MAIDDISLEPLFNARTSLVAGYQISDQQTGATAYFGYLDKSGNWYIMKSVTTGSEINYTYTKGNANYATNWTARASLSYDRFNVIF